MLRSSAQAPDYEPVGAVVFIVFNRADEQGEVHLPDAPAGQNWVRAIDTDQNEPRAHLEPEGVHAIVAAQSLVAFVLREVGQDT